MGQNYQYFGPAGPPVREVGVAFATAPTDVNGRQIVAAAIDQSTPGTSNAVVATGNVASGAADSGNPVKVGGVYNATAPTLADGQRGNLPLGARGMLLTTLVASAGTALSDSAAVFTKMAVNAGVDKSVTATTTSQLLMAANNSRLKFFIKNDTAIAVYVNFGATAVASAGAGNYQIAPNGGWMELTGVSSAINIIAASTTAAISAREH